MPSPTIADLIALYDLPDTGDLMLSALAEGPPLSDVVSRGPGTPLDPSFLTLLEGCLTQADVARFARRQSVWRVNGAGIGLAWEDRTLSIPELTAELAPGYDLQAEPWLFRRLTRTLDRRVLALLASPGELAAAGPFAMSLNVASLLGAEFLRFDTTLPACLRGRVVLALSPADIVADARSARFAIGFARTRGYRLLLRTDTSALLAVMAPASLEFDYVELPWTGSLPERNSELPIELTPDAFLLTGCESPAAIEWGITQGIHLFAGAAANAVALV